MKKLVTIVSLLLSLIILSGTGLATTVTFTDNQRYWGDGAGWGAGQAWNTDVPNGSWNGNLIDVIGDPDITDGAAEFTDQGNLTRITFNYVSSQQTWAMLAPGYLFINILNGLDDTMWDYVVATMGTAVNDKDGIPPSLAAGDYNLYEVALDAKRGVNDNKYIQTGADNTSPWAGYYIRNNHPIGVNRDYLGSLAGSVYFSGFPGSITDGTPWTGTTYYDFGNGLDLDGKDIVIGWEMTCANDVVYAAVANVPEPATMLLLGLGLVGLAGVRRKIAVSVGRK